jgi:hypothetical protein
MVGIVASWWLRCFCLQLVNQSPGLLIGSQESHLNVVFNNKDWHLPNFLLLSALPVHRIQESI